jgi:hypothetical protein
MGHGPILKGKVGLRKPAPNQPAPRLDPVAPSPTSRKEKPPKLADSRKRIMQAYRKDTDKSGFASESMMRRSLRFDFPRRACPGIEI